MKLLNADRARRIASEAAWGEWEKAVTEAGRDLVGAFRDLVAGRIEQATTEYISKEREARAELRDAVRAARAVYGSELEAIHDAEYRPAFNYGFGVSATDSAEAPEVRSVAAVSYFPRTWGKTSSRYGFGPLIVVDPSDPWKYVGLGVMFGFVRPERESNRGQPKGVADDRQQGDSGFSLPSETRGLSLGVGAAYVLDTSAETPEDRKGFISVVLTLSFWDPR